MPQALDQLRTSLADCYDIERELGRGGMATVYLARDLKHDRQVAVKVLLPDLSFALGPERFRREIDLATHVSHPHILPVYDSGEADGLLYYVMPYVAGQSLRDRLIVERQLSLDDSLRIACQIAGALDHAHRHGIVHRDIKPENILLEDGQALIADFGIARALSAVGDEKLTKTGISLGTPAYMSPEQAMADPYVDGRSDIYSLGCVLYEMLAGTPPFTGPTAQAVIARHALAEVPSLTVARSTISDEVEDAVLRAMSKVPADRYATAGEFAEALMACQQTGGRSLGRSERRERARPKARRVNRRVAMIGAGVGVLVIAGIGWGWPLITRGPQSRDANGGVGFDQRRIAVLYFVDRSPTGDLGPLADGLTEDLIEELKPIGELDVISRNGVAPFRGTDIAPDSVAKRLEAGTVVSGSIDRVRNGIVDVDVRLYEGNTGIELAKTHFARPEAEILAIRDSVPGRVATLLREALGTEVRLKDSRAQTSTPAAWLVYQRGERFRKEARRFALVDSGDAARRSLTLADSAFARAESLDPRWPEPILGRAWLALNQVVPTRDNLVRDELIGVGLGHADRALALDARNAEALELRGTLRYLKRYLNLAPDPTEAATLLRTAESDLREATRLDKSRASAWNTLSLLLYRKFDRQESYLAAYSAYEADAYLESAKDILWRLYATSYDLENFVNAKKWCDQANTRYPDDPRFAVCRLWLMTTNLQPANAAAAWEALGEIKRRMPATQWEPARRGFEMLVAVPIARAGNADSARRVIEGARAGRDVDPNGELIGREVLVRTLIGDKEKALELLAAYLAAFPQHREGFVKGNTWWWRPLQDDPRFKALVGT
jgi:serine/threonine-protein kinase